MELIAQGAEAKLFRDKNRIIKERLSKDYRLPQLDKSLRQFRTRREAKVLRRLDELDFPAPKMYDFCDKRMTITMDFVNGKNVRDVFDNPENRDDFQLLAEDIGKNIAMLHHNNMIHGDLTTSNMIKEENEVTKDVKFIDFGLAQFSDKVEDRAVDLFLLDRALETKHYQLYPEIFEKVLAAYKKEYPTEASKVLERFEAVKKRGRNKNK